MQTLLKRWQMYKERLVLGIDAGTTKIKAALLDEGNHFIDVVSKDVEVLMPFDGACEMDMNVVWCIVCEAVTELYGSCLLYTSFLKGEPMERLYNV